MKNRFKAIIFDMDGTIIETEHIWKHATAQLITSRGITMTPDLEQELAIRLAGLSSRECCLIIKELTGIADPVENLVVEKGAIANALYAHDIRLIHGFETFHQSLDSYNLKTGLATNASPQTVAVAEKTLNLSRFFGEHMYNIAHVNFNGKPSPDIYLHAAKQLDVDPQFCIAIEDSAHGIEAAQKAGMFCIGINSGNKPQLLKKADVIIDGYHQIDLPFIMDKLNNN
jgi:HAD superfamily hydrolase (TIGR01509 family)